MSPNTSTVGYSNSAHNQASNTQSTLGGGNITVAGEKLEIDGVNFVGIPNVAETGFSTRSIFL